MKTLKRTFLYVILAILTFGIGIGLVAIRSFVKKGRAVNLYELEKTWPKNSEDRWLEENAVYAALIKARGLRAKSIPILVQSQTISTMKSDEFREGFFFEYEAPEGLSRETFEDYRKIDPSERRLDSGLDLSHPVVFLDQGESKRFFETEGGRSAFGREYPHSEGIVWYSRVGFNKQMDQALVYRWLYCGGLCGDGGYIVLKKTAAGWEIADSKIWIS
jgi:hypothetical protein